MRAMRLAFSANGIWATIIRCAPWTRVLRNRWCFVEEVLGSHPIPWVPKENTRIQPFSTITSLSMKGYCTDLYFDHALSFMQQAKARNRPFFVYLPTNAPHGPFHDVPQAEYDFYRSQNLANDQFPQKHGHPLPENADLDKRARIFAMIDNIDQNVGNSWSRRVGGP